MLIYLDESGCLGFDFSKPKTTSHLFMTALVCADLHTAKHIKTAVIRTIKNKFHTKNRHKYFQELKGSNSSITAKRYFLSHIDPNFDWQIYTIIADKKSWLKKHLKEFDKNNFYNEVAKKLLLSINFSSSQNNVSLIVDKSKTKSEIKKFNDAIIDAIKPLLLPKNYFTIEHKHSFDEYGLQAADMFCWGTSQKYHHNDAEWYEMFVDKIAREFVYKFEA